MVSLMAVNHLQFKEHLQFSQLIRASLAWGVSKLKELSRMSVLA